MITLDELAQAFQEKGLGRQAVLLDSKAGSGYVRALLQPRWQSRVEPVVGEETYSKLLRFWRAEKSQEERLLIAIFGRKNAPATAVLETNYQQRDYRLPSLEIHIESQFDFPALQKAAEVTKQAAQLTYQAHRAVYNEVAERIEQDEALLYEMYMDRDIIPGQRELRPEELQRMERQYQRKLTERIQRTQRMVELDAGSIILLNEFFMLSEMAAPAEFSVAGEGQGIRDSLQEKYNFNFQEHDESTQEKMKEECLKLAAAGERLLKENPQQAFTHWLENLKATKHQRVIKEAKKEIKIYGGLPGDDDEEETIEWLDPFSEFKIENLICYDQDGWTKVQPEEVQDKFLALFKTDLPTRQKFLEVFNEDADRFFHLKIGLEQLLAGGPITNPEASPVSVLQNHYHFPNIPYSEGTLAQIREINTSLTELLNNFPDISDLAAPTYLRKKKNHTYVMVELPKDPLDVTFGNDSGCCIFVPENREGLQNGMFVPFYLTNQHVRLFGLYRVEANGTDVHTMIEHYQQGKVSSKKVQRMGMVLAFETVNQTGGKVLACNSLELSRFGLAGGNITIQKVVDYAEKWLIGYAQNGDYRGLTMGRHRYNTSVNFSSRRDDVVEGQLEFTQRQKRFYSDIFAWDNEEKVMRTRPRSCYWLWKEER